MADADDLTRRLAERQTKAISEAMSDKIFTHASMAQVIFAVIAADEVLLGLVKYAVDSRDRFYGDIGVTGANAALAPLIEIPAETRPLGEVDANTKSA